VAKKKNGKKRKRADGAGNWYAVRCVFRKGWYPGEVTRTPVGEYDYEERITLWSAPSMRVAIKRAEKEARRYASSIDEAPSRYLDFAQGFRLFDRPQDGAEVFSLIRRSGLKQNRYLDSFFDTGTEFQQRA
jgi:hypothetical protein